MHKAILHQNIQSKKVPKIKIGFNKATSMEVAFGMSRICVCVCAHMYVHTKIHSYTCIYRYMYVCVLYECI